MRCGEIRMIVEMRCANHATFVIARLVRAIQYAAAMPYYSDAGGILDHPLSRMMTTIGRRYRSSSRKLAGRALQ